MHWAVAAPFFGENPSGNNQWLDDFVPPGRHSFTKILPQHNLAGRSWHDRVSRNTPARLWLVHWNQVGEAWKIKPGGIITSFPQLAMMAGWRKRFSRRQVPVVAWSFNVGGLYGGVKQSLARFAAHKIDRFIVHSRRECETISRWLNIPASRLQFVPLQRAPIPITEQEQLDDPFVLAMGSANRDYQTFFDAVARIGVRTIVVTARHSLNGLTTPSNVELQSSLSPEECHLLAQKARINVVPLIDHHTAAGQVTIVEAMRMFRPVIASRCVGSEDYIDHGKTGMLVQPYSVDELASTINQLWHDKELRDSLAREAGRYAQDELSDEVTGSRLGSILDQLG
jgi:glycosyltransferase involved in cell wall biosynthesis